MTAPESHSVPRASRRKTRWKKNLSQTPARHGNICSKEQPLLFWGPNTRYQQAEWAGSVQTSGISSTVAILLLMLYELRLPFKGQSQEETCDPPQWDPKKTKGKVPLICLPKKYLLVSRYLDKISEGFEDTHVKCFYFLTFLLFPRVIWGYVEHVQL